MVNSSVKGGDEEERKKVGREKEEGKKRKRKKNRRDASDGSELAPPICEFSVLHIFCIIWYFLVCMSGNNAIIMIIN